MSDIKIKSIKNRPGERITEKEEEKNRPKIIRKVFKWLFILVFVFIIGGFGGVTADRFLFPYLAANDLFEKYEFLQPKETEIVVQEKETVRIEESGAINEAIQKAKPSVVSIIAKDSFEELYVFNFNNESYGSGFVVTSDGLIVTDSNVVGDINKEYIVFTDDGRSFESQAVYKDTASDMTFLKVEANNLPVVSFAVSDDLMLGQKVIAVGRMLNNSQSLVSLGVIKNKKASILGSLNEGKIDEMIFTDAEINSANSGGPLIDLSGKVCGLNVLNKEGNYSYTIPMDLIRRPLDNVISSKEVKRFDLGIKYVKVTPYIVEKDNLPKDFGIYLPKDRESVGEEGLAYKAGIREGDLIYKVGDFEVRDEKSLLRILEDFNVGDRVNIEYIRENAVNTAVIELE